MGDPGTLMDVQTEPYSDQLERWPSSGRVMLAQYDDESVVLYQAYRPANGHFAAAPTPFGGGSRSRMTLVEPGSRWVVY